jgi:hypothetical protein
MTWKALTAIAATVALSGCMSIDVDGFEKARTACDNYGGVAEVWAPGFGNIEVVCGDGRAIEFK